MWSSLNQRQALPIMLVCLHDLRNADDLALRQAAAQALDRFIESACVMDAELTRQPEQQTIAAPKGVIAKQGGVKRKGGTMLPGVDVGPSEARSCSSEAPRVAQGVPSSTTPPPAPEDPLDSPLRLLARMFYSQLKSQLGSASLAVRQEHLTLMRLLATKLPARFPDLALLASPEVCAYGGGGYCPKATFSSRAPAWAQGVL